MFYWLGVVEVGERQHLVVAAVAAAGKAAALSSTAVVALQEAILPRQPPVLSRVSVAVEGVLEIPCVLRAAAAAANLSTSTVILAVRWLAEEVWPHHAPQQAQPAST